MATPIQFLTAILLLSSFNAFTQQTPIFQEEHLLYVDARTELPVLVVNDTTAYTGFDFDSVLNITFPSHKLFSHRDSQCYTLKANNKNYLIGRGAGPVTQIDSTAYKRIDRSFEHKNQYGANSFSYNNILYLWGGYGLFTFKNILIKYNFKTREWEEVDTYGRLPEERTHALQYVTEKHLYVFGGYTKKKIS